MQPFLDAMGGSAVPGRAGRKPCLDARRHHRDHGDEHQRIQLISVSTRQHSQQQQHRLSWAEAAYDSKPSRLPDAARLAATVGPRIAAVVSSPSNTAFARRQLAGARAGEHQARNTSIERGVENEPSSTQP